MTGERRAIADLNALLNRFEANPVSARLMLSPERAKFETQLELDDYLATLGRAAAVGSLRLEPRKGRDRHNPPRARVIEVDRLYEFLGRRPSVAVAVDSLTPILGMMVEPWMQEAVAEIRTAWSRGRDWWGIGPTGAERIGAVAALALAIAQGRHRDVDYRTLSVQVAGDSKFLERHEAPLVRFLSFGRELEQGAPRAVLSALGLERISAPFHISGPISLGGVPVPVSVPYLAVPHGAIHQLSLTRQPRALLTVENFVSFHRHAIEANGDQRDVVLYTGGQPSIAWQQSIAVLRRVLPDDLPKFHWSDIDAGGLEIFLTIERLLGTVRPHLMSTDIAESVGYIPPAPVVRSGQFAGTTVDELGSYLAGPTARCVEQEALDPRAPSLP